MRKALKGFGAPVLNPALGEGIAFGIMLRTPYPPPLGGCRMWFAKAFGIGATGAGAGAGWLTGAAAPGAPGIGAPTGICIGPPGCITGPPKRWPNGFMGIICVLSPG
jgi:hypothetical protein